jgi:hypothetical protein
MGIREWSEKHPKALISLVSACIGLTIVTVVVQVLAGRRTITTQVPDGYFTVDDGKTFFVASGSNIPPFDYQGQQAVSAYVFECAGKRFVGYVERYTPEAHREMVENRATPATQMYGRELKKPGENNWIKSGDLRAVAQLTDIRCPDGGNGVPEPVEP